MKILPFQFPDLDNVEELRPTDWNPIFPAYDFYLKSEQCHPIKIVENGVIAGLGAIIVLNDVAWFGHIIVRPEFRNRGIGQLITRTLMDNAEALGCKHYSLIATDLGAPVYEKLGFKTVAEYAFFKDLNMGMAGPASSDILPYEEVFKDQVRDLDREVSGENRMELLTPYLKNAFLYVENDEVKGYYIPDLGDGVINARTFDAGIALVHLRLKSKSFGCFPVDNRQLLDFFEGAGHQYFKTAKRMSFGEERSFKPRMMFSRIGGNLG